MVISEMHEIDNRERRKIHAMDFIRNQAITPILVGRSALELVSLFEDL